MMPSNEKLIEAFYADSEKYHLIKKVDANAIKDIKAELRNNLEKEPYVVLDGVKVIRLNSVLALLEDSK